MIFVLKNDYIQGMSLKVLASLCKYMYICMLYNWEPF